MRPLLLPAFLLIAAAPLQAEEISCKGTITSIQGEGIVARTHRFEVTDVTGSDLVAVLDRCKKIALERQNRAARLNPGGSFRKVSEVQLQCVQGSEKFEVRRVLRTAE